MSRLQPFFVRQAAAFALLAASFAAMAADPLLAGFETFKTEKAAADPAYYASLAEGQHPAVLAIACSDSRVDPAILFSARSGEIFTVRSIAAIVPAPEQAAQADAVMSAVEYAVKHLKVSRIAVIGHSGCGGMNALLHPEGVAKDAFIAPWVQTAAAAKRESASETEKAAARLSAENLKKYAFVAERAAEGKLAVDAFYYDIAAQTMTPLE